MQPVSNCCIIQPASSHPVCTALSPLLFFSQRCQPLCVVLHFLLVLNFKSSTAFAERPFSSVERKRAAMKRAQHKGSSFSGQISCLYSLFSDFSLFEVATFILQKILLDDTGLAYICQTYERFSHVAMILVRVFVSSAYKKLNVFSSSQCLQQLFYCSLAVPCVGEVWVPVFCLSQE